MQTKIREKCFSIDLNDVFRKMGKVPVMFVLISYDTQILNMIMMQYSINYLKISIFDLDTKNLMAFG